MGGGESRVADHRQSGGLAPEGRGGGRQTEKFGKILGLLAGDAPPQWRTAVEVAIMNAGGYQYLDGVVGSEAFRVLIAEAHNLASGFANEAGVIDEEALRECPRGGRRAGMGRAGAERGADADRRQPRAAGHSPRARVPGLARYRRGCQKRRDRGCRRPRRQLVAVQPSLSDALFVRFTKDKWGLGDWTDNPYEGVVDAIVKRIEEAGGEVSVTSLVEDIPARFEVLPATVRNYLGTRKFQVDGDMVRIVAAPIARNATLPKPATSCGRRTVRRCSASWSACTTSRATARKVSVAVAQYLGVGPDGSVKIPFAARRAWTTRR